MGRVVRTITFEKRPLSDLPEMIEHIYREMEPDYKIDFLAICDVTKEYIIHASHRYDDTCAVMIWRNSSGVFEHLDPTPTGDRYLDENIQDMFEDMVEFAHECLDSPQAKARMVVNEIVEDY